MLRVRLTGSGALVDRLQAHLGHQSSDAMAAHDNALPAQMGRDLTTAKERVLGEHAVDFLRIADF